MEKTGGIGKLLRTDPNIRCVTGYMPDELFGPVMPVIPFSTLNKAIEIANNTPYRLGSSIWTKNMKTAHMATERIRSGVVWINGHLILPPKISFGNTGYSRYGRENGFEFTYEYTELKNIFIYVRSFWQTVACQNIKVKNETVGLY
jgi:acyl-CoA reductase-like NAD-dependent aldehyde dehydrogenase